MNKVDANPDNFQVLLAKRPLKKPSVHIQNSNFTCEQTVKLLGIKIDYFDVHISPICRRASQQFNFLKRLALGLDRLSKLIFHTFILSNFYFLPFGMVFFH